MKGKRTGENYVEEEVTVGEENRHACTKYQSGSSYSWKMRDEGLREDKISTLQILYPTIQVNQANY